MRRIFYILIVLTLVASCSARKGNHVITSMTGEYIPIKETNSPDPEMVKLVDKYKSELDKEMNIVVGYSAHDMFTGRPESMLTNLTADLLQQITTEYSVENATIDIAFVNVNGIRAPIAKGEITKGDIFDAFPFDNSLSIVELKGEYVTQIFESYARLGGAGVSGNVRLKIKEGKLIEATIDDMPVDNEKVYTIITLEYLAEGNDGMEAMANASSIVNTEIKLRDYLLDHLDTISKQGKELSSELDGRITIIK